MTYLFYLEKVYLSFYLLLETHWEKTKLLNFVEVSIFFYYFNWGYTRNDSQLSML